MLSKVMLERKGRFRTPYHYGVVEEKTRHWEKKRKKLMEENLAAWMDIKKGKVCNFGKQGLRSLERHDCQCQCGRHMIIISSGASKEGYTE